MATITVPGAQGNNPSFTYTGSANSSLALSIQDTLNALLASFTVTSVGSGSAPPAPGTTGEQELQIIGGGSFTVPSGYQHVVVDTTDATTVTGGTNLIAGDGSVDFTNTTGASSSVLAGNGDDSFNLSGTYTTAGGSGTDYWNLSGSGVVSMGAGTNFVNITGGGADTIFAAPNNTLSIVSVTGGTGPLTFVGNSVAGGGIDVISGSSQGNDLIVGGSNEAIDYFNPNPGTQDLLVAGAGNETLIAAYSKGNDILVGSATPGDNDEMIAPKDADGYLVGGAGTDTLIGTSSSAHHYFFIIRSADQIAAGAKPTDLILNANSSDFLDLAGMDTLYGPHANSGAAAKAVSAAFAGGSSTAVLRDGTTITFVNSHGANGIHIISS